jgi:hypothetical protein
VVCIVPCLSPRLANYIFLLEEVKNCEMQQLFQPVVSLQPEIRMKTKETNAGSTGEAPSISPFGCFHKSKTAKYNVILPRGEDITRYRSWHLTYEVCMRHCPLFIPASPKLQMPLWASEELRSAFAFLVACWMWGRGVCTTRLPRQALLNCPFRQMRIATCNTFKGVL